MSKILRLSGAATGMHLADQTALVAVPLVAVLSFGASPELIGVLVACQSSAHLIGSVPLGILVDTWQLRTLAVLSALTSLVGFGMALASTVVGSVALFGLAITLAGFGVVLFGLTALSIVPRLAGAAMLARVNAAIDIPRAVCTFAAPLAIGWIIADVPNWMIFALAMIGCASALAFAQTLPRFDILPKQPDRLLDQIKQGGGYVVSHRLLRPIALCAVFWNLAFAALLVVLVPAIQDLWQLEPEVFGFALSAFGIGAISGSSLSARTAEHVPPYVILLFGPGSSVLAAFGMLLVGPTGSETLLYSSFFLLGLGPSMWLNSQNSVRQLVSPPAILGRVNAVIQTTIYGVRPAGAIVGGLIAGQIGPLSALLFVTGAFMISFLIAASSDLRKVASYEILPTV